MISLHETEDGGMEDENGAEYCEIDGGVNWPEWPEECSCGAELPDVCEGACSECGQEYWQLVAEQCACCGEHIPHDSTYWLCLDGGETYCQDCVSVE